MASQSDVLIQRRKAALAAKSRTTPTIEPAEVPAEAPKVQPLTRPAIVAEDPEDVIEDPGNGRSVVPSGRGGAVALPNVDLTRTLGDSDVIMPKLKISQAMSKVNADDIVRQGNWYHTTFNDNLGKTVLIIPVDMRKSRSYFVPGKGVLCRSFDLLQGEGDPGLLCEGTADEIRSTPKQHRGCPLRLWGERDESGRSAPPSCSEAYNYPVLILDPDDPENGPTKRALLTLRGTAANAAKHINTLVTDGDYDWHEVVLELGLESKTNSKGTFFIPTVRFHSESGGRSLEKATKFAATVNAASIRATVESDGDD